MKKWMVWILAACVAVTGFGGTGTAAVQEDNGVTAVSGSAVDGLDAPALQFEQQKMSLCVGQRKRNPLFIQGDYVDVQWKVNHTQYAHVDQKGFVTLKKQGVGKEIQVTATVFFIRNQTAYEKQISYVAVGQIPVASLSLEAKKDYVFVGKQLHIKKICMPQNVSSKQVVWKSSNEAYATVNQKGYVKPKKAGTGKMVTISATTTDGSQVTAHIRIKIIDLKKPMIALTFDDGPSEAYTSRIVDKLEAYDARATFFVLGSRIQGKSIQKLLKRSVKNGNEIASHTYDHKNLASLGQEQIKWEETKTKQQIENGCGVSPVLLRPPYGSYSTTVKQNITVPMILWSIDTRDWQTRNTEKTVQAVMQQVSDGDIILMHDIYDSTASAAEQLIPKLAQKGYQMVTVSELATYKKKKLKSGNTYTALP